MDAAYTRLIDADQNRIEWVECFDRFEKILSELREYAPGVAERLRGRFYEEARQPLIKAERGRELVEWAEEELNTLAPLSWEEAVRAAAETDSDPLTISREHREWAKQQQ